MPSVLHLLCTTADEQTRCIHQMLVKGLGSNIASSTRMIGAGEHRNLPTAILRLRNERANITYAWGVGALAAAVVAGHPRIVFSPDRFAGPRALRWIRPLINRGDSQFICPTHTQKRLAIRHGIDPGRCEVIPPGVDFGLVRSRRDPVLRSALGFGDHDYVLIAPGESTVQSGHDQAVWSCGILNVLDQRNKLLLWGRGSHADAMTSLADRLKQRGMICLAEQKLGRSIGFETLLAVADVCLVTPAGTAPTLPIATAMAAGLPIVSTVTYMLAELLEDRHTALMVPTRSPRALVQRILDLRDDAGLQARLTDTARAEAYEHFSMTRMLDAYRGVLQS